MFNALRRRRQAGRAKTLKREADETIARLTSADDQLGDDLMITITNVYAMIASRCGPISDLSRQQKLDVALMLTRHAQIHSGRDSGKSYGCALLSMHFESLALPGPDAGSVATMTHDLISGAFAERAATEQWAQK